ncbi:hypothetical protein [Winogradskyella psychrotolerans]|uniref:hypothetical protein n=1 Tax=Winogradskyella psychrotolerans TaxID=1344585 RepID=UPI001C077470|nr:hypothetical protein [Winogradskyella psychrotolerans]MBU2928159.1 hypothetical protein [Winogradskyella psychrotolerans]
MIKFFRYIRKDLMEQSKTSKYFKYAIGEIVLVVIGILIALQLNNLNDERKTENLRQVYYKQLLQDFEKDKKYIKEASLSIDSNMVKYKAYKETFNQPNLPTIQIINNISNLNWLFKNVQFKSNTISTIENTGDIKLIPPIIREKLISLEKYKEETENVSKYNNDRASKAEFNASQIYGSVDFVFKNIKNQPKLLEWVFEKNRQIELLVALESSQNNKVNSEKGSLIRFKKILADMEEIEILINKELKK